MDNLPDPDDSSLRGHRTPSGTHGQRAILLIPPSRYGDVTSGSAPKVLQKLSRPSGFRLVRGIQVMETFETLDGEIWEM